MTDKQPPERPAVTRMEKAAEEQLARQTLRLVVDDYDARREHWWGRFLLWLLRKTTRGSTPREPS